MCVSGAEGETGGLTVCASVSGSGIINITSGLKSVEGEKAIYSPTAEGDSPPPLIIHVCAPRLSVFEPFVDTSVRCVGEHVWTHLKVHKEEVSKPWRSLSASIRFFTASPIVALHYIFTHSF